MINELKDIFGSKCSAITVDSEVTEFINVPSKTMKFCEAVKYSFNIPIRLINTNLGCPGARRSAGFDKNDEHLAEIISKNNNIPLSDVTDTLNLIPALQNIHHINLGLTEYMEKEIKPDLYILYVKSDIATNLIHHLERHEIAPSVPPYSLLSVCGNVFANCYINRKVSISFGCPESIKYGGIEKDEVVLGLPYKEAKLIIDNKLIKVY